MTQPTDIPSSERKVPPARKRFGEAPRYRPLFHQLAAEVEHVRKNPGFLAELDRELILCAGRPSSLFHARRLSEAGGGAQVYLKREDLMPQDSLLTTAITAQALCARRLGKRCLVTATRDGPRGVATAAIAARMGLESVIYMGDSDADAHEPQVFRMQLHGARLKIVSVVHETAPDIRELALQHWQDAADSCFLVMGLDSAPAPYPSLILDAAAVVGREVRFQVRTALKRSPDLLVARHGNSADALGLFEPYLQQAETRLACVSVGAGLGISRSGLKASSVKGFNFIAPGQDSIFATGHSGSDVIRDGLDYPSVEREHKVLKASQRVEYVAGDGQMARTAIRQLSRLEGLIPSIQTAHALAWAIDAARVMPNSHAVVLTMVERCDGDLTHIRRSFDDFDV